MKLAVCGILPVLGLYLSISRKDDPNKIGFIGGKVDESENIEDALIRESLEETGLSIEIDKHYEPFIGNDGEFTVYCYMIQLRNEVQQPIDELETGVIKLANKLQLTKASPFGSYNEKAFEWFNL